MGNGECFGVCVVVFLLGVIVGIGPGGGGDACEERVAAEREDMAAHILDVYGCQGVCIEDPPGEKTCDRIVGLLAAGCPSHDVVKRSDCEGLRRAALDACMEDAEPTTASRGWLARQPWIRVGPVTRPEIGRTQDFVLCPCGFVNAFYRWSWAGHGALRCRACESRIYYLTHRVEIEPNRK